MRNKQLTKIWLTWLTDIKMRCWMSLCQADDWVLALLGYSAFELTWRHLPDWKTCHWLFPWSLFSRGRFWKSKPILNSLTWPLLHASDLGPLVSLCQMGCQEVQELRDVEDILLIGEERFMTWLMACLPRCLNWDSQRSISQDGLTTWLVWGRYLIWTVLWIVVSSCANTWSACWMCWQNGFHCQMWSDMFFKLMSADGQYDRDVNSGETRVYLGRLKDRVTLVYWDYYRIARREKYSRNFTQSSQD